MKKLLNILTLTLILSLMLTSIGLAGLDEANEPVFSYRSIVSLGSIGEYGGYDLKLFKNGELEVSQLEIGQWETTNTEFYELPLAAVEEIYTLIKDTDLNNVPRILDNGSTDGIISSFGFNYTYTKGRNIFPTDETEIKEEYLENARIENKVFNLFNSIAKVFSKYGYGLTLFDFKSLG